MTRKTAFFGGWAWFKFNNLGLALGTNVKFYTSVAKGLKLKVRMFWGLNPAFVEVIGEKLVGGFFDPPPPILNRVKYQNGKTCYKDSVLSPSYLSLLGIMCSDESANNSGFCNHIFAFDCYR